MKTILFIDGQNFLGKLKHVFESEKQPVPTWNTFDFRSLFGRVLEGLVIDEYRIYFAKLHQHPDTLKKSRELIEERRFLKKQLEVSGFIYIVSGNVRANSAKDTHGRETIVFKEKGVDTKIVTDLVVAACDKLMKTVIIASSDSDLQPAVKELKNRGIELIYLGFEIDPNRGLSYTTDRTILIRNSEVLRLENTPKLL